MNKNLKYGAAGLICSIAGVIALVKQQPDIRTSEQGLAIIGNAEGCRREPYYCPANVLTVGIGSTEASGQKIELNRKYSDQEIAERWANDIRLAEQCVNRYGNGRNMPQGAFDAMVSLTFNVGCGAMQKSTLFRLAQTKYSPEMCEQFPRWNKAGGKVLKGLTIRREKERALCLAK
ncbi:lysozyme [Ursidibacter sp. B-7004-1]